MPVHRNNRTLGDGSAEAGDAGAGASRSPIRLRQLRCFLAATDHGSFRKAATALTINESSVSRQIRDLEDELGEIVDLRPDNAKVREGSYFVDVRHGLMQVVDGAPVVV